MLDFLKNVFSSTPKEKEQKRDPIKELNEINDKLAHLPKDKGIERWSETENTRLTIKQLYNRVYNIDSQLTKIFTDIKVAYSIGNSKDFVELVNKFMQLKIKQEMYILVDASNTFNSIEILDPKSKKDVWEKGSLIQYIKSSKKEIDLFKSHLDYMVSEINTMLTDFKYSIVVTLNNNTIGINIETLNDMRKVIKLLRMIESSLDTDLNIKATINEFGKNNIQIKVSTFEEN